MGRVSSPFYNVGSTLEFQDAWNFIAPHHKPAYNSAVIPPSLCRPGGSIDCSVVSELHLGRQDVISYRVVVYVSDKSAVLSTGICLYE